MKSRASPLVTRHLAVTQQQQRGLTSAGKTLLLSPSQSAGNALPRFVGPTITSTTTLPASSVITVTSPSPTRTTHSLQQQQQHRHGHSRSASAGVVSLSVPSPSFGGHTQRHSHAMNSGTRTPPPTATRLGICSAPMSPANFHQRRGLTSLVHKKNIWGEMEDESTMRGISQPYPLHVEAEYRKGLLYHHGLGVDKNLNRAIAHYRKAAAECHLDAVCAIASMYAMGEGVHWADPDRARQLYKTAAVMGHAHAQFKLGEIYESGLGVPVDLEKAHKWYRESAKQTYAPALCNLGTMFAEGEGVRSDSGYAFKLLNKAAEQGLPDAQCCLAMMYLNGEGVDMDERKAEEYYMRAAEQGHALAQLNLGHLYYTQGNAEMAKECWELAARQGVSLALCNLGAMYSTGQGVPQSYTKAHEYYSAAAHKGDFEAQYQMGLMYENGHGVKPQPHAAMSWFKKAAQQGHTEAMQRLRLAAEVNSTSVSDEEDSTNKLDGSGSNAKESNSINKQQQQPLSVPATEPAIGNQA